MNGGLAALLRYWWVAVIGIVVGVGVAIVASSAKDEPYTYSAETRILVTSAEAPYYRTEVTRTIERAGATADAAPSLIETSEPPELATLIRNANLYPQLIESDLVSQLRDKLFGPLQGSVDARTVFSFEGANRFEESNIPVIQIVGIDSTRAGALDLSEKTTRAFMTYIDNQQTDAGIVPSQRVLIQPLTSARVTDVTGGPVYGIPVLLGIAVIIGFCGLALLLDAYSRRAKIVDTAPAPPPAREESVASAREEPLAS